MPKTLACPRCGQLVSTEDRICSHCGVDLILAAVLAENDLPIPEPSAAPMAPEVLVPRLGEYLLERGVLKAADLQRALEHSKNLAGHGQSRLLGQILLDLHLVDRETLDQVVTEQILSLQAALQQSNQQLEQRVRERTADLQRALSKLSELNHLKSNFISNISHELRTPLTHIKGYLSLLSEEGLGELNEAQKEAVDVLMRAEARLEQLIEDLIWFSLAARGELTLNLNPARVGDLVYANLARADKLAKARKITLKLDVKDDLPLVQVDGEKVSWVLLQLLDNAIKFTPQGGTVQVSARRESGLVTVAVTDTGIGIPAEKLEEIFEPFHQLESSDNRRFGGTGLGLALVRRIVEAHGSQIKVLSQVGRGSRFEFSLPAMKEAYAG
jgi:signal transduction histidine kinase